MLTLLLLAAAHAADDPLTVRGASMGGARVALAHDNATVAASPGMVGLHERFDLHAAGVVGPTGGLHWSASAVDARTSDYIAVGFAYAGDRYHPDFRASELPGWTPTGVEPTNVKRYHDLALTAGVPLFGRRACIGIGGTWSFFQHDVQGKGNAGDLDVGLGLKPIDQLAFAIAVEHLLPGDPTLDRPLEVSVGTGWGTTGPFVVTAEGAWQPGATRPFSVGGGVEGRTGPVRIRGGGRHDGPVLGPRSWATWGLAVGNDESEFGYAMQVPFDAGKQTAASLVHTLGVQFGAPRIDDYR